MKNTKTIDIFKDYLRTLTSMANTYTSLNLWLRGYNNFVNLVNTIIITWQIIKYLLVIFYDEINETCKPVFFSTHCMYSWNIVLKSNLLPKNIYNSDWLFCENVEFL